MGVSLGAKPSPNPDPALDPNLQTRYRSMVRAVRPSPELDREVLASARRLRSRSGVRPSGTASIRALVEKPRTRRSPLSRRAFVATAFGLGAVALVIGIPTALRRPDEKVAGLSADRPADPAELAKVLPYSDSVRPVVPARCRLAMLGGATGPVPVPATSVGIVPVDCLGSHGSVKLRVSLAVQGEGIESVRYSLERLLSVNDMGAAMGGGAMLVAANPAAGPNGDTTRQYFGFKSRGFPLEGTVGEDGSFLCPDGDAYLLYCRLPYEAVRALDSVLDAYWSWNTPYQETVLPPEPTEDEEVRAIAAGEEALEQADRLNAMLDELYANPDVFYEWMRTCFVRIIGFLGQQLEEGTLVLEASFTDGSYERHGYRIGLTDDYEEAAADRFDALVESSPYDIADGEGMMFFTDDGVRSWSFTGLPFWFFLDGQPFDDAAEADPRLSRPLFTVEEVPA